MTDDDKTTLTSTSGAALPDGAAAAGTGFPTGKVFRPPVDRKEEGDRKEEVAAWAQVYRTAFKTRRAFNFALCDRLAARRMLPNVSMLRDVGAWGTSTSIKDDVEAWYEPVYARSAAPEPDIPLAARVEANGLIERLWGLARKEVDAMVAAPIREELASAQDLVHQLREELGSARGEAGASLERARRAEALHAQAVDAGEAMRRDLSEQLAVAQGQAAQARIELVDAQRAAADRLAQEQASHRAEVAGLQARLQALASDAASERTRLLLQVDEARQGMREAGARLEAMAKQREADREAQLRGMDDLRKAFQNERDALLSAAARAGAETQALRAQLAEAQAAMTTLQAAERQAVLDAARAQEALRAIGTPAPSPSPPPARPPRPRRSAGD